MQLESKAVLVTGAARGMGRATAEQAAEEGARVAVADLNIDGVEAVAKGIRDRGGEAIAIEADVGDLSSIDAMVDATIAAFGGIDILVNNAGITRYAPFLEVTERRLGRIHARERQGVVLHAAARGQGDGAARRGRAHHQHGIHRRQGI